MEFNANISQLVLQECLSKLQSALGTLDNIGLLLSVLVQNDVISQQEEEEILTKSSQGDVSKLVRCLERKDDSALIKFIGVLRAELCQQDEIVDEMSQRYNELKWGNFVSTESINVPIVELRDSKFSMNMENITNIFERIGSRRFVTFSINGRTRGGKSFRLNNVLKYLTYGLNRQDDDWVYMRLPRYFDWDSGVYRITSGIQAWNEPFFVKSPTTGEEIAIVVLDCQGFFDDRTEIQGNALLFAFSLYLSSVFVYNDRVTTQDVFSNLQTFTRFAKSLNIDKNGQGDFLKKFVFNVCDWNKPGKYKFGYYSDTEVPEGQAKNYKAKLFDLTSKSDITQVASSSRDSIKSLTHTVGAFLSPHPGINPDKGVPVRKWNPTFRDCVVHFVKSILSDADSCTKTFGGEDVTGLEMLDYISVWKREFENVDQKNPDVTSVLRAASELQALNIVTKCRTEYETKIKSHFEVNSDGVPDFESFQEPIYSECIQKFNKVRIGSGSLKTKLEELLKGYLDTLHRLLGERNDAMLKSTRLAQEMENKLAQENEKWMTAKARGAELNAEIRNCEELRREAEAEIESIKTNTISSLKDAHNVAMSYVERAEAQLQAVIASRGSAYVQKKRFMFSNGSLIEESFDCYLDGMYNVVVGNARNFLETAQRDAAAAQTRLEAAQSQMSQ